jgi:hypothetical protein
METATGTQPAVTGFVLGQLSRLDDEATGLERMAAERRGRERMAGAMDRLRRRLAAQVVVQRGLLVAPSSERPGSRDLLALAREHDRLEHRAAVVQAGGCPAPEVVALTRELHAHLDRAGRAIRLVSGNEAQRLATIPPWRAEELFERAGGPTDTWPGEWLG